MGLFVRCAIQCGKLHKKKGGVAEWTKAAALKAVEGPVPSVGSNPTPSAIHCTRPPPRPPGRALFPWLVRPEGLMIDTSRRDVFLDNCDTELARTGRPDSLFRSVGLLDPGACIAS